MADVVAVSNAAQVHGANGHPSCDIHGYDCECEPKPYWPAENRTPTFAGCEDYIDFGNDTPEYEAFIAARGYDAAAGWTPLPKGNWGSQLNLDQPNLFGHEYWNEWRFGIAITDANTGEVRNWCPAAGVTHTDDNGEITFYFVYDLPDNESIEQMSVG